MSEVVVIHRLHADSRLEGGPVVVHLLGQWRVDNLTSIASELGIDAGARSAEHILGAAYQRWGTTLPIRLRGRYIIVLQDIAQRLVFVCRDHLGHVPCFYHVGPRHCVFATGVQHVFERATLERRCSEQALADQLAGVPGASRSSVYEGIEQLPAGHALRITQEQVRIDGYWRPELGTAPRLADYREYYEGFQSVFRRAVARSLTGSTRVGALLSGGLDSSAVVAMAATLRPGRSIRSFTLVPNPAAGLTNEAHWEHDERPYVNALAERHQEIEATVFHLPGRHPLEDEARLATILQGPPIELPPAQWIDLATRSAKHSGCDVLLTGQLGEAVMSWWGRGLLRWLLSRKDYCGAFEQAKALGLLTTLKALLGPLQPRFVRDLRGGASHPLRPWLDRSCIQPHFARKMGVRERFEQCGHGPFSLEPWLPRSWVLDDMINGRWGEAYSSWYQHAMHYGVRSEDPSADVELVEYCLSLPDEAFVSNSGDRALVREGLRSYLPETIRLRRTKGLQCADMIWRVARHHLTLRHELMGYTRDERLTEIFDIPRLVATLDSVAAKPELCAYGSAAVVLRAMGMARFVRRECA